MIPDKGKANILVVDDESTKSRSKRATLTKTILFPSQYYKSTNISFGWILICYCYYIGQFCPLKA
jgi:hypothetical protein